KKIDEFYKEIIELSKQVYSEEEAIGYKEKWLGKIIPELEELTKKSNLTEEEKLTVKNLWGHLEEERGRLARYDVASRDTKKAIPPKPETEGAGIDAAPQQLPDSQDNLSEVEHYMIKPLTPEAEDLLKSLDVGGALPSFIANNLKKIMKDNDIEITGKDTVITVVEKLRKKKEAQISQEKSAQTAIET
ncbi:MAG: hypothetical protein AAB614_03360, partial [Patescibacteria group bacterium]